MSAMPSNEVRTHDGWRVAQAPSSEGATAASGYTYDSSLKGEAGAQSVPPGFVSDAMAGSKQDGVAGLLWSGAQDAQANVGRTNSFTNLAEYVGSGLAESMEDATKGEHTKSMLTDSFLFNGKEDISYARHSRHAASRLLGVGQSKDAFGNHKAPEAGSLFASFESGERGAPKAGTGSPEIGTAISTAFTQGVESTGAYRTDNSKLSTTRDLGMTVMEPDSKGSGVAGQGHDITYDIQRDMQKLWSSRDPNPVPGPVAAGAERSPLDIQMDAEAELRPFAWDVRHHDASRCLAIMYGASLSASDIRSICETYGAIENFRSDFVEKGVFFVSYYDMRCAQFAAMELQPRLQKLGPSAERVRVQFCVPLNSSSQNDESLVVLMDVPQELNVESLAAMLSSYGAVRSLKSIGANYGGNSFIVEYHDIQDAKQAVLELESNQQFGPNVSVEVGARNPSDRKRGRELLALIGRWRHGGGNQGSGPRQPHMDAGLYNRQAPPRGMGHQPDMGNYDRGMAPGREPAPQLVLGPDGRYTYMVVNHTNYPPQGGMPPQYGDRVIHSSHGTTYVTHVSPSNHHQYWQPQTHHFSSSGSVVSQSSSHHSGHYPSGTQSLPYFRSDGSVGSHSHHSHHSHRVSVASNGTMGTSGDNQHLVMDLDAVENGRDSRTSLMVRNIPNKYTQQMLLNEFTENGHGPGVIDFFYLPIDFKNRCNRGYAFINFVDYRDILAFHRRYFGKHWRTFNSDKICDITYARIQGKAAMLKRFENSALMEKDDEYKPLVFVSNGPEKGSRLPFPSTAK